MQKHTSKNTALNQLPKVAKYIEPLITSNAVILDYGCGRSNKFKEFAEERGATYFGYDPYWLDEATNVQALASNPSIIVCANVLNVIMEDEVVETIVSKLARYNALTYIQIYEGKRDGIGGKTTKGYQRNQRTVEYQSVIEKHFNNVVRKGNIFICC